MTRLLPMPSSSSGSAAEGSISREELWSVLGWRPSSRQEEQFEQLQAQLRLWNSRHNLTRLVEGDDYWIAQVFDSLWPLVPYLEPQGHDPPLRVIDVGTGGGFPGLAVAVALPEAQLTLVDSVGRKVEAVRAMALELGLAGRVELRCERIEQTGRQTGCRGAFDWAIARAVASAPVVAEYLAPLLRPDGKALLYRGQWGETQQRALSLACLALRLEVSEVVGCDLPRQRGQRHGIYLRPLASCPKAYPRAVGLAAKHPLGEEAMASGR